MLFSGLVLAAATSAATQFFTDFGGNWTCGSASYHAQWSITSPDGDYWTIVQYGLDPQHPGGTAYVGYLPQSNTYIYDDYHNDGSFAQLTASVPTDGVWRWTGKYYAAGAKTVDSAADITWMQKNGTIVRKFRKNEHGTLTEMGADTCTKR